MVKIPEGSHIENGWSDEERRAWLDSKARPDGFVFEEQKEETKKKDSKKDV